MLGVLTSGGLAGDPTMVFISNPSSFLVSFKHFKTFKNTLSGLFPSTVYWFKKPLAFLEVHT